MFLRKHLLLKGMPIHFLFCNKAFDSCFEHLLFRSEMMVLCLLITKAVPGAWSLILALQRQLLPALQLWEQVDVSYWVGEGTKDWISVPWKR